MSLDRRTFLGALASPLVAAARPRNILFIAVDDLRPKLGCYGDLAAISPNIDRLARGGMVFERAYCQQALCGPSRASLLTGLRPDTTRVYDLKTPFRNAVPDAVTLPACFKRNGYRTESYGKIFHNDKVMLDPGAWSAPEQHQIVGKRDQYVLPENRAGGPEQKASAVERADVADNAYVDGKVADLALSALERIKDDPFFIAVGYTKPHLPFAAPSKYWDLYDPAKLPLAANPYLAEGAPKHALQAYDELRSYADYPKSGPISEKQQRTAIHGYYACVSYTDALVGRLLDALDRYKLADNTVVVLWGDHGWHLGEQDYWGKTTNFEICVRAPLVLRVPGNPRGQRTSALTEFVDLYPTLTEACGLKPPASLEGISAMPLLRDPSRPWKRAAFSQYLRQGGIMGQSMRTDRYRFTEWLAESGEVLGTELYDHSIDSLETRNLAGEAARKPQVEELRRQRRAGWRAALPA